jgi:hypothetical protein
MAFQITGIRKPGGADNIHDAISHYRWVDDGKTTSQIDERLRVVGWVESGIDAYVADGPQKIWCEVRQNENGTKFLQTVADGEWSNNLLALPEC